MLSRAQNLQKPTDPSNWHPDWYFWEKCLNKRTPITQNSYEFPNAKSSKSNWSFKLVSLSGFKIFASSTSNERTPMYFLTKTILKINQKPTVPPNRSTHFNWSTKPVFSLQVVHPTGPPNWSIVQLVHQTGPRNWSTDSNWSPKLVTRTGSPIWAGPFNWSAKPAVCWSGRQTGLSTPAGRSNWMPTRTKIATSWTLLFGWCYGVCFCDFV